MKRLKRSPKLLFLIISALIGLVFFVYLLLAFELDLYITWLIASGGVTFVLYGFDKFMAINRSDRVPEIVLHLMSLVGGVVGGWLGMALFRHKKNKIQFLLILIMATVIHLVLLYQRFPQFINN